MGAPHRPLAERLWDKIDASGPCWLWTGCLSQLHGYGRIRHQRRTVHAHRAVWETLVGPIPEGLTIDHLCRVRRCVNPDHLEPVTNAENTRRGFGVSGIHYRKTHCYRGHPFSDENTYIHTGGGRRCRICKRENDRAKYVARTHLPNTDHQKKEHTP